MGYLIVERGIEPNHRFLTRNQNIVLTRMARTALDLPGDDGTERPAGLYFRGMEPLMRALYGPPEGLDGYPKHKKTTLMNTLTELVTCGLIRRTAGKAHAGNRQCYQLLFWTEQFGRTDPADDYDERPPRYWDESDFPIVMPMDAAAWIKTQRAKKKAQASPVESAPEPEPVPAPVSEPVPAPKPTAPLVPTAPITISDRDDRRLYRQLEDVTLKLEEARERRARFDDDCEWVRGLLGSERINGPRETDKLIARLEAKATGLRIALGKERAS